MVFTKPKIPSDFNRMAMCKLKIVKCIHKQHIYIVRTVERFLCKLNYGKYPKWYILINTCVITTAILCLETKKHLHIYLAQPITYHRSHTESYYCVPCSPSPSETRYLRQVKFITKKTFLVCTADQSMFHLMGLEHSSLLYRFLNPCTNFQRVLKRQHSRQGAYLLLVRNGKGGKEKKTCLPLLGGEETCLP